MTANTTTPSPSSITKPVLISGAGLSSLLLAQSLLQSNIPFEIYESDSSLTFRAQGYRLRLSALGLDAIESVLPPPLWQKFWETCSKTGGGGFGTIDALTGERIAAPEPDGEPTGKKDGGKKGDGDGDRDRDGNGVGGPGAKTTIPAENLTSREGKIVGISRGDMRRLFLTGCESHIHWSHRLVSYTLTSTGVHAIFADGTKSPEGSLLVGGDGIHSQIAKQLSGGALKVYDTGARGIHGQAPTTAFKGLGEGVWRMVDDTNPSGRLSVITNVRPNDMHDPSVAFGWTMAAVPGVINPPNNNYTLIGAPAADLAKSLTRNWHTKFRGLFDEMNVAEAAFWKITCSTPTGVPEWESEERVTVIGDAVHSMTPAGGIGANTAVRDSALLGRLLGEKWAQEEGNVEGVTKDYEREMRIYGSEAVRASYGQASKAFGVTIDSNTPTV